MNDGLYEDILNKLIQLKISELDEEKYFIKKNGIHQAESAIILSRYIREKVEEALSTYSGPESIHRHIEISNKIIELLKNEISLEDFDDYQILEDGKIISALYSKVNSKIINFEDHIKKITPSTRLSQSELFTGNNSGISMESEL